MRTLIAVCLLTLLLACPAAWSAPDHERQNLDILYAGKPGSERMADFKQFLSEHFERVETTSLETFTAEQADDYDVVVFDWVGVYRRTADGNIDRDNFGLDTPRTPELPADYDKPTVLVGVLAAQFGQNPKNKLKFDWL